MFERFKKYLPYLLINIGCYFLLPLLLKGTTGGEFILMITIPFIVMMTSLLAGYNNDSFCYLFSILIGVLFVPVVYLYMNTTALVYAVIFMVLSFGANYVGYRMAEKDRKAKAESERIERKNRYKKKKTTAEEVLEPTKKPNQKKKK